MKNRICHRSLMQTEKSQPEGKRIMPETSSPRCGISQSASEIDVRLFFRTYDIKNHKTIHFFYVAQEPSTSVIRCFS